MNINKHYVIFIWIIVLIIFTFYCIFRIKYIREKYMDVMSKKPQSVVLITRQSYDSDESSQPTINSAILPDTIELSKSKSPNATQNPLIPITTQSQDIISYINNIQKNNEVTDIPDCQTIYDDNYSVQELGYNNCSSAYADYLEKNLDVNNLYGKTKTLANICPVSARTPKYNKCSELLLTKFADNNTILDNVNKEMTSSINKRIDARTSILNGAILDTSSFISDKNQIDFNNDMLVSGNIPNYPDERLSLINNYYQDKYKGGIENFTNLVDPYIENKFFGKFKSVNGQYIAFTDLLFILEYDTLNNTTPTNKKTSSITNISSLPTNKKSSGTPNLSSLPTNISPSLLPAINITTKPLLFSIINNDLFITYDVINIDFYKKSKKAIKIVLSNKNIVSQTTSPNTTQQLLSILGLHDTSQLIFVVTSFVSSEGIKHTTYKLVNDNLDTIIVLNKQ